MDSPNAPLWSLIKTLENTLVAIATALEPIAWPFVSIFRLSLYASASVLHKLGDAIVHSTAAFMAAVLRHPDVVDAAADVMVAGMNAFAAQPDLSDKLSQVSKHMTQEDKQEAAVQIGRDLPLLMGGILHGVFHRNGDDDKEKQKSDDEHATAVEEKRGEETDDAPSTSPSKEQSAADQGKVVVYINDETNGQVAMDEKDMSQ